MRFLGLAALSVTVCGLVACDQGGEPPPKAPPAASSAEENERRERERDVAAQIELNQRAAETKAEAERVAAEPHRSSLVESVLRSCAEQEASHRARLAELEPLVAAVREKQARSTELRASDEAWVRSHCVWANDPRYALEARRRASPPGSRTAAYEVNERMVGFASSAPICPKEASQTQLVVASEIAANIVNNGRVVFVNAGLGAEDKAAVDEQKDLLAKLQLCEDVASGKETLSR